MLNLVAKNTTSIDTKKFTPPNVQNLKKTSHETLDLKVNFAWQKKLNKKALIKDNETEV
jgi:hypothetical protein